jgi:hypothetical protein
MENEMKYFNEVPKDLLGAVFEFQGEIYRRIKKHKTDYVRELMVSKFFKDLMEQGLMVNTAISDLHIEDSPLTLKHEKIRFFTHPQDWSFDMLKDAAIMTLEINAYCRKHGYELQDPHPHNATFRGASPIYVDLGSFAKMESASWSLESYHRFLGSFYLPLKLWSAGEFTLAKQLLLYGDSPRYLPHVPNVENNMYRKYLNKSISISRKIIDRSFNLGRRMYRKYFDTSSPISRKIKERAFKFYVQDERELIAQIQSLKKNKSLGKSRWNEYQDQMRNQEEPSERFRTILNIFRGLSVDSYVDLAGNAGYLSCLIQKEFPEIRGASLDYDENAVNKLYRYVKEQNRPSPTPINANCMEAVRPEWRADCVFALAVTHHLLLSQECPVDAVLRRITDYSNRYGFMEFMPWGFFPPSSEKFVEAPSWYRLDWFKKHAEKYLDIEYESLIEENWNLFFGTKKRPPSEIIRRAGEP